MSGESAGPGKVAGNPRRPQQIRRRKATRLACSRENHFRLRVALTHPDYGLVPPAHCAELVDEGDIRLLGRRLTAAARQAEDLLLVFFAGHGLLGPLRHDLYPGLPDSEWAGPEFNSLEYDKLRSAVLESRAETKIIILDCCFRVAPRPSR